MIYAALHIVKEINIMITLKKTAYYLLIVLMTISTFFITPVHAQSTSAPNKNEEKTELKVGTSSGDFGDLVREFLIPAMKEMGYRLDLTEINDIVIPNISVDEGALDFNIFQHKPYMDEYNANNSGNLYTLVQVPTAPYGIYAGKSKALTDIHSGATIAIPSNVTNYSRGLWILEALGWIKLRKDADRFALRKTDILENPYHLNIKEVDAAQIPRVRQDIDFAIINGNFAHEAGIPFTQALFIEPSKYFVNWVVINEKNRGTKWAKVLEETLNSTEFKTFTAERFPGYNLPLSWEEDPK